MLKVRIRFGGLRYLTIFVETKKQIIMSQNNLGVSVATENNNSEFETALDKLRGEVLFYHSNVDKVIDIAIKLKPITENEIKEEPIPSGDGLIYRLNLEISSLQQLNKKLRLLNAHMEKIVG